MRWERIGKIFDPEEYAGELMGGEFAKSPQALVLDDRVRVFFTTQVRSSNGKFLSRPYFADFDRSMKRVIRVSKSPVVPLGQLGHFDEHGIFPFSVTQDGDRVLGYSSGWSRRKSVSIEMSIGLAVSNDDGLTFAKHGAGGPIMTISIDEPCLVGDAFVRHFMGRYHMWYIFGDRWQKSSSDREPERFYRIAHAVSDDAYTWKRDSVPIISTVIEHECQALPTVLDVDGAYHMIFCYRSAFDFRANRANAYRLGYAVSTDLETWERKDDQLSLSLAEEGWDAEMMCYPNLFALDGEVYLLYNGNDFGRHGFGLARLLEV